MPSGWDQRSNRAIMQGKTARFLDENCPDVAPALVRTVGGFLAGELFGVPNAVNGINVGSIVVAFLGAIAAIALVRALPGRSPL